MTGADGEQRVDDTSARFVIDSQVAVGGIDGEEPLVLASLGSLALGTEYAAAMEHQGPPNETLHFVMNPDQARELGEMLILAAESADPIA